MEADSEPSEPDDGPTATIAVDPEEPATTGGRDSRWSTRAELWSFAELLGATSIAIAQPVLGAFGNDASSFVHVDASGVHIVLFAAIVVLAPPVCMWVAEVAVGLFGRRPRRWAHLGFVAACSAVFVSRMLPSPLGALEVLVVVIAATAVVVLLVRTDAAHQFLRFLALSPLIFVCMFLFFTPVRTLLFGSNPEAVPLESAESLPPIVMIVFDELPLGSLLDGEGRIDAEAYPGFSTLAEDSTFARNHTTVAPSTVAAVPAILTGKTPETWDALPVAASHPRNVFTLLGDGYEVRADEYVSRMCPPSVCETRGSLEGAKGDPLRTLLRQVPGVFTNLNVAFNIGIDDPDVAAGFTQLADGTTNGEQLETTPTFDYLHAHLPHQPWRWLPGGKSYDAPHPPTRGDTAEEDRAPADIAAQRHLLQVAYADELLQGVLEKLHEAGVYDDTLIVVTSDHGVSFGPDEPLRGISETNGTDIMWTPLLIKAPGQQEAQVVDVPTASIDVLPTLVDMLGLDTDWTFDGQSIHDEPRPDDWQPRSLGWKYDEVEPADDGFVYFDGEDGHEQVLTSRALDFDEGWDLRFWRRGTHGDLVGQDVDSFDTSDSGDVRVTMDGAQRFEDVDPTARSVPAHVSGHVVGGEPGPVAVSVNGVLAGWYETSGSGEQGRPFQVMVPPSLLRTGANEVEVFLVEDSGDQVELVRIGSTT